MAQRFVRYISTALVGFSFAVGTASAQQQSSAEEQVLQLEKGYCTAFLKRDAAWLDKYLADDYTGVVSHGESESKAEALASLKDPQNSYTSCTEKDLKVRVYGDAAVATGRQIYSGTYKGKPFKDREVVWTDTFVRKGGRWQAVASHSSHTEK
jgi:ketosteroid isomerase-like protein